MSLSCPLCSVALEPSALSAHVRYELKLPLLECRLCPSAFCDEADALDHFTGPEAKHPGQEPGFIQPPVDPVKRARLHELLRLARGGPEAVMKRLCVCGQCRLVCRDDLRLITRMPKALDSRQSTDEPKIIPQTPLSVVTALPALGFVNESEEESSNQAALPLPVEKNYSAETEEDFPMAPDVKPILADFKQPFTSGDGIVSCIQCGKRVDKNSFANHVRANHIPGNPFQCLLCPFAAKKRQELVKHQKSFHDTELSAETHFTTVDKAAVQKWITLCFGEAKGSSYAEVRCRTCDKPVRKQDAKRHISTVHLKKPLFICKLCGKQEMRWEPANINTHVKTVHKQQPGPDTIDSSALKQYGPIIKAMIQKLFDKCGN